MSIYANGFLAWKHYKSILPVPSVCYDEHAAQAVGRDGAGSLPFLSVICHLCHCFVKAIEEIH